MAKYRLPFSKFILIFILSCSSWHVFADEPIVDTDLSKPIKITANSVIFNKKTNSSTYVGKVLIIQGSMKITCDKVVIYHPKSKLQNLKATGSPAHFKKYLAEQKKWIEGHASKIHYQKTNHKLLLLGKAYLKQGKNNTIAGSKLIYDFKNSILEAENDKKDNNSQVHIIFSSDELNGSPDIKGTP